mmetsp:Transcript_12561/g.35947  ORF Transcript_12561/g.35947 Transcript_12561/m.35947 type:complete len:520 (-) Transcript_12561:601-2160(-)
MRLHWLDCSILLYNEMKWISKPIAPNSILCTPIPFQGIVRCLSNLKHNITGRVGMTNLLGLLAHFSYELIILQPAAHFVGNAVGILAVIAEATVQHHVDVAGLLTGKERGEHHRQTDGGRLGDGTRTCLGHQDVGGDHVLRHVGDESQPHHVDPAGCVMDAGLLLQLLLMMDPVEGLLYSLAAVRAEDLQQPPALLGDVAVLQHPLPILGVQLLLQLVVAAANDADGRVDAGLAEFGVQPIDNVRQQPDALPTPHDQDHLPRGIQPELGLDVVPILLPLLRGPIAQPFGLDRKVMPDGQPGHYQLVVLDPAPSLGQRRQPIGRHEDLLHVALEPRGVGTAKVGHYREERYVPSVSLANLPGGDEWDVVHGRVDADDDVRVVLPNAPTDAALARQPRVEVVRDLVEVVVGKVVEETPLVRVGRQMLVGRDEVVVRPNAVVGPDVEEVVGGAGVVVLEGFGQGFGRRPMAAAGVRREEQDAERSALFFREEGLGRGDFVGSPIGRGLQGGGTRAMFVVMLC